MVNEIIGLALLGIIFAVAITTVLLALLDREKEPTALLGVVHPQKPQDARRGAKTTRKE